MINIKELNPGDVVLDIVTDSAHTVIYHGEVQVAVRAFIITNPAERALVPQKANADFFRMFEAKLTAHNFNPLLVETFIGSLREFYKDPTLTGLLRLAKAALASIQ